MLTSANPHARAKSFSNSWAKHRNVRTATADELQNAIHTLHNCGVHDTFTCHMPGKALLQQVKTEVLRRTAREAAARVRARIESPVRGPYSRALGDVNSTPSPFYTYR